MIGWNSIYFTAIGFLGIFTQKKNIFTFTLIALTHNYTNSNLLCVKCNQRSIKDIYIRISVHSNFFPWNEVQCKQRRRGDSENNHKMNDVSNDDRQTDQKLSSEIEQKIVRKIFKFRNVDCLPINIYRKSKVSNLGDFVRIGRG